MQSIPDARSLAGARLRLLVGVSMLGSAVGAASVAATACGSQTQSTSPKPDSGASLDATSDRSESETGPSGDAAVDAPNPNGCPAGRGPSMVRIPAANGGTYCIDSTEVTQSQFAAFLAADGGGSWTPNALCTGFVDYIPGDGLPDASICQYDPASFGDRPVVCVDYCAAMAFCSWSGKRLCKGDWDAGPTWQTNEWINACTAGGQDPWLYGSDAAPGTCVDDSYDAAAPRRVASLPGCQSAAPSFAGTFDMLGNVNEWTDDCNARGGIGQSLGCFVLGGSYYDQPSPCIWSSTPPWIEVATDGLYTDVGFRCCAGP